MVLLGHCFFAHTFVTGLMLKPTGYSFYTHGKQKKLPHLDSKLASDVQQHKDPLPRDSILKHFQSHFVGCLCLATWKASHFIYGTGIKTTHVRLTISSLPAGRRRGWQTHAWNSGSLSNLACRLWMISAILFATICSSSDFTCPAR